MSITDELRKYADRLSDEALERRIDELCRENERLRQQVASIIGRSFRTADKMDCLDTENAKLRELLAELYEEQCDECDRWKYRDRMCELGILKREA